MTKCFIYRKKYIIPEYPKYPRIGSFFKIPYKFLPNVRRTLNIEAILGYSGYSGILVFNRSV